MRDSDCRSLLETRTADGCEVSNHISTQPLVQGFRHSSLDVAAFALNSSQVDMINALDEVTILNLPPVDQSPASAEDLTIAGFRLVGESGSGTEAVVSSEVGGRVAEVWNSRVFVDTGESLTEMGMCGGPAVMTNNRNICVGILEGLVPEFDDESSDQANETHKRLQNKSVLVGTEELRSFLRDVEAEIVKLNKQSSSN